MHLTQELALLLRARIPVINIVGTDEVRIVRLLEELAAGRDWPQGQGLYAWDLADQFHCHRSGSPDFDCQQQVAPDMLLQKIDEFPGSGTFILKDFHHVLEVKKSNIRKLRNLAQKLASVRPEKNIILITPEIKLPPELKEEIVVLDCPRPTADEIDASLSRLFGPELLRGMKAELRNRIVTAALGLTATQVERVLRKAAATAERGLIDERCLDLVVVEKQKLIRESGALELVPYDKTISDVGGLEVLKRWLELRGAAFSDRAQAYGLDLPRGLALVGISGTGKSLCARLTAGMWKLPLLRLDMGAVFGGLVGLSERNIRDAIQISEVIAPCILWVDEIEKAFAGTQGDSGTTSRVLATFLTWMAEKQHPVFVFATANDMKKLPPEFFRKGRFDEVFFLDLPTREERKQILAVHLKKKFTMIGGKFDLDKVADATAGFVGAELEAVVKDAMFPGFLEGEREIDTDDLLNSAAEIVPLAKSHAEVVEELRKLVTDNLARNATKIDEQQAVDLETVQRSTPRRRLEL